MKLYRIHQDTNNDYDTYDSAVVAAETEAQARTIHPNGYGEVRTTESPFGSWVAIDKVRVEEIGTAKEGTKAGVIVSSFNAG